MIKNTPKRTLQEAIDLDTMRKITSNDLLTGGMDYYQKIRHEATNRHLEKNNRYVCARCGYGVYVALSSKKQPLWSHYKGAPQECPWWTGDPDTVDNVSASIFQGQQESPLHNKLKYLIEELLSADRDAQNVQVEKIVIGQTGRRKPDIQATYKNKNIAFEVQLATTQIPIILSREKFYRDEKRFLIWLTWQFEEKPLEAIQQSFLDVYYRHSKNIFSLDDETIELSRKNKTLVMRVHAFGYQGWKQKLVTLDDLIWPDTGLPYAMVSETYSSNFRNRWLDNVTPEGIKWKDQNDLLDELFEKFDFNLSDEVNVDDIARAFNCMLSLEHGTPIGTRETNLFAYANSFLNAKSRHKYADLFEWTAKKFKRHDVLEKDTVKKKLVEAKQSPQIKGSFEADIIRLAFADWF